MHMIQAIHDLSLRVNHAQLEDLIADCDAKLADAIKLFKVKARNGSNTNKLHIRIRDLCDRRNQLLSLVTDAKPKPVDYSGRIMREDMRKSERALRATR